MFFLTIFKTGRDMRYQGVLAAVLMTATGSAYATEYLQNGSFETGDVSGWDLTDPLGITFVAQNSFLFGAQDGDFYVYAPSPAPSVLAQTFADTAGQQLTISGWAIGDASIDDGLGAVSYFFDGMPLGFADLSSGNYTRSTFQVTATGSDTFSIEFSNVSSANGLDNFSVTSSDGAVPEPSTLASVAVGFRGAAVACPG
jgi:hypothetical protein